MTEEDEKIEPHPLGKIKMLCDYCQRQLIDCSVPADLCDRLNLTVAVGRFTIQEEAIAYKCICGKVSIRRFRSFISYQIEEQRNPVNPLKEWETGDNIEMGWGDKDQYYKEWEPNHEKKNRID